MVWFSLILAGVSFLALALLAPKPQFENATAQELDPKNFPMASENDPVQLGLGCYKISNPNTLTYGGYRAVPIRKKIKTGLFSSSRITVGHNYYLTIDLGLCLGPADLKQIFIDSEPVEPGIQTSIREDEAFYNDQIEPPSSVEDSRPAFYTATSVPFDVEFDASAIDSNLTIYDIADLGISEEVVDAGGLTLSAAYEAAAGAAISPDNSNCSLGVTFWDGPNGTGSQFVAEALSDSNTAVAPVGTFGAPVPLSVEGPIPAGTRSIIITAVAQVIIPANLAVAAFNHTFTVSGTAQIYSTQAFDINEPELYGGREQGGGHVGNATYYPGTFDQDADPDLEALFGVDNVPGYQGVAHLVLPDNYIGESPQLRKMEFLMSRYVDPLGIGNFGLAFEGSEDHSLANALYFIMTDGWSGLDVDTSLFDTQSFIDAHSTLETERNGGSIKITAAQDGKRVVSEILKQMDGVIGTTTDGRAFLKLIRDDYDPNLLDIYDEADIIDVENFSKNSWADVANQVKVIYSSREKESQRIALAQNGAIRNMVGKTKTIERNFPFCYDPVLANELAARTLAQVSAPLVNMTLLMNRNAFGLNVGDVFKVNWTKYGISELIVRVQDVDRGELDAGQIRVEVIQDQFSVGTAVFGAPEDTSWTNARPVPETVATQQVVDMPRFFGRQLEEPVEDGFGAVIPFPLRPKIGSSGFDLNSGLVDLPTLDYFDPFDIEYPIAGQLTADLDAVVGYQTGIIPTLTLSAHLDEVPEAATTAEVQAGTAGILYINGEWMAYEGVTDNMDGTYTLSNVYRALLGSRPISHTQDDYVYFLATDMLGNGDIAGELTEDGTIYYKVLDRVGGTARAAPAETTQSYVMQDVADRPLRPRNLTLDGDRVLPKIASGMLDLTWVTSNREAELIAFETDAAEVADQAEQYNLEVWVDGVQDMTLSQDNVTSPHSIDFSSVSGNNGEIRLYAQRTGGDTKVSVEYAWMPVVFSVSMDSSEISMDSTEISMDTV